MMASALRSFHFTVTDPDTPAKRVHSSKLIRIGVDFELSYRRLQHFCVRPIKRAEIDLLVLIGAVAVADRRVRRSAKTWARHFEIQVPVHVPDLWNLQEVQDGLSDALFMGTGDHWNFQFVPRRREDRQALQLALMSRAPSDAPVVPFSAGVDSFAVVKWLNASKQSRPLLLSTALNSKVTASVRRVAEAIRSDDLLISIPLKLAKIRHAEPTYRSRAFVFYSLAALACVMQESRIVCIGENGQGSLGTSLVPFGHEHPYQGTHPLFTNRLSGVLSRVLDSPVHFVHPFVWQTKAEVLRTLALTNGLSGIEHTVSCSRDLRSKSVRALPVHCGICSGCLLRRLAFSTAGVSKVVSTERYVFEDLDAPSIGEGTSYCKVTKSDRLVANAAVLNHQFLAELANQSSPAPAVERGSLEAAEALELDWGIALQSLQRLVSQHAHEWHRFLSTLSETSWVRSIAGESL